MLFYGHAKPYFLHCGLLWHGVLSAYLSCDEACCHHLKENAQSTNTVDFSGATALSALLVQGEETFPKALFVANCGDTRGVLCEEVFQQPGVYEARRLTYDHKADDPEERRRIKALGGSVKNGRSLAPAICLFLSTC